MAHSNPVASLVALLCIAHSKVVDTDSEEVIVFF